MKLNERLLESLASDDSPPDKAGFLMKKGEVNKGFQRRYFVLRGNMLFYFEKKQDRVPIGVIILENCHVELSSSEESRFAFQIIFNGTGCRRYVLAADDDDEMINWMTRITHAGFSYMKTLVEDLEKRLEKLKKAESEMVTDTNETDENLLSFGSDEEEKLPTTLLQQAQAVPDSFSRSKCKTLPSKRPVKKEKVSLAELDNRWSMAATKDDSQLLETRTKFHDWVDFSERTDFLCDDTNHLTRRFSINDFTPPSFMELKKHENLDYEAMVSLQPTQSGVKMHETVLPFSLASRIKGNRRAKTERNARSLPLSSRRIILGGSFYSQNKPSSRPAVNEVHDNNSDSHFQHLHRLWGASIWVKVREYEVQHGDGLESEV